MMHPSNPAITPYVSIIIPALDEAAGIEAAIRSARSSAVAHEIIVVDAGSRDQTAAIAEAGGCRVLQSPRRQRAAQLNLGARHSRGEVLLFLHADTRLAPAALPAICEALRDPSVVGGAFVRRYDKPSRVLALTCWLATLRNRWIGWHLGDQAIFARASAFRRCGGFANVDQFEDLEFSRNLAARGRIVTLRPPVISAARRFADDGPLFRTLKDAGLALRYAVCGLPKSDSVDALEVDPALPARAERRAYSTQR